MAELRVARSELILGGQRSGKTHRAEVLAAVWLAASREHRAVYVATGPGVAGAPGEALLREQAARAARVPGLVTEEEPTQLAHAIGRHSQRHTLIVVDCLTLWLTALLLPQVRAPGDAAANEAPTGAGRAHAAVLAVAIDLCAGPLVLVSNETGLGPPATGGTAADFLDALGSLNQQAAAACERVTLMVAGLALPLKGPA